MWGDIVLNVPEGVVLSAGRQINHFRGATDVVRQHTRDTRRLFAQVEGLVQGIFFLCVSSMHNFFS